MKILTAILLIIMAVPCLAADYRVLIHIERTSADTTDQTLSQYFERVDFVRQKVWYCHKKMDT